jgi:hypothetical protein
MDRRQLEIVGDTHADAERQPDQEAQRREEKEGDVDASHGHHP